MSITFDPTVRWATDAIFSSGPLIGTPTKITPSVGQQAAGVIPDAQMPAQEFNWIVNNRQNATAVQAHAALTGWSTRLVANPSVNAYAFALPYIAPSAPAGAPLGLLMVGATSSNGITTLSLDGGAFSTPQPTTAAVGFQCVTVDGFTIFGEVLGGGGGGDLTYSLDAGATWAAATSVGNAGTITAVHKAPGGHYLAAYDGNVYRATALSGTWAHTVVHSHDTAINFVDNGSTVVMLANFNGAPEIHAWYSLDDGVTWTSATNFGASTANASITYSKALGLFVVVNGNGEVWTSPDGIAWLKRKTAAGLIPQLPCGPNSLAACGNAICALIEFGTTFGFYDRGIAYTFDFGASWYFAPFGQNTGSSNKLQTVKSWNGRLVACDRYNVYVSGALEAIDVLYTGV